MLLKNTTKDLLLLLGLTIVFALSFITYEQNRDIFLADFDQKLQSLDLGFSSPQKVTHLLKKSPEIIHGKLFGYQDRPIIERMDIDIKLDDYKTILKDRNQAMKLKLLADPTIVKAKISYQGKLIKAKLYPLISNFKFLVSPPDSKTFNYCEQNL